MHVYTYVHISWLPLIPTQRFLTSFRVLELKELLKIHGQSTKGRKPELFQRANEILQFGSPKFQTQIREIYERSNISRKQLNSNRAAQKSSPVKHTESVIKNQSRSYIVHPDVRFKVHPFFSKIDTITRPTALGITYCALYCIIHVLYDTLIICYYTLYMESNSTLAEKGGVYYT